MKKNLHQQLNPQITIDDIWSNDKETIIDVRSPDEFKEASIPGSFSVPLLSNEEKSTIGIFYKNYGPEAAIKEGYTIFEPKLESFRKQFEKFPVDKPVSVYCARGGMRSRVITSFMRSLGFNARQVKGGYKTFRTWNLEKIDSFVIQFPIILHGKTGVGKTLVINHLENSLDLEGLAQHRGSLFGAIGKAPVSQKTFEAVLLATLEKLDNSKPIFIEGESRKIGNTIIPNNIFKQMKSAKVILLEAPIETRVKRIIDEYILQYPEYHSNIKDVILMLKRDLGKKNIDMLLDLFDNGKYDDCFKYILLNYYDKKYSHSMKNLTFETTVSTECISDAAVQIKTAESLLTAASSSNSAQK